MEYNAKMKIHFFRSTECIIDDILCFGLYYLNNIQRCNTIDKSFLIFNEKKERKRKTKIVSLIRHPTKMKLCLGTWSYSIAWTMVEYHKKFPVAFFFSWSFKKSEESNVWSFVCKVKFKKEWNDIFLLQCHFTAFLIKMWMKCNTKIVILDKINYHFTAQMNFQSKMEQKIYIHQF